MLATLTVIAENCTRNAGFAYLRSSEQKLILPSVISVSLW